jgi:hypothetical protein
VIYGSNCKIELVILNRNFLFNVMPYVYYVHKHIVHSKLIKAKVEKCPPARTISRIEQHYENSE